MDAMVAAIDAMWAVGGRGGVMQWASCYALPYAWLYVVAVRPYASRR